MEGDKEGGVIYVAHCIVNGKVYVGQAKNFVKAKDKFIKHGSHRRWIQHVWEAFYRPEKGCTFLNKAIVNHGEHNFILQEVHECKINELNFWEAYFVAEYKSNEREYGYNLTSGGDGYQRTEETLQRMSVSMKESFRKRADDRDRAIIDRYSLLDIQNITIKTTNTPTDKQARVYIRHSGGIVYTGIRAQNNIADAVKRAYNISLSLVERDKITLMKTARSIIHGDINDMRETP